MRDTGKRGAEMQDAGSGMPGNWMGGGWGKGIFRFRKPIGMLFLVPFKEQEHHFVYLLGKEIPFPLLPPQTRLEVFTTGFYLVVI